MHLWLYKEEYVPTNATDELQQLADVTDSERRPPMKSNSYENSRFPHPSLWLRPLIEDGEGESLSDFRGVRIQNWPVKSIRIEKSPIANMQYHMIHVVCHNIIFISCDICHGPTGVRFELKLVQIQLYRMTHLTNRTRLTTMIQSDRGLFEYSSIWTISYFVYFYQRYFGV